MKRVDMPAKDTTIVWTLDPDTGGWHSEGRHPIAVAEDKQIEIQIAGYACRLGQERPRLRFKRGT